jgi:hypothetical protein
MVSTSWFSMAKSKETVEFGDFQTPNSLTKLMLDILVERKIFPTIIIEPTCGVGGILLAAYKIFSPQYAIGIEINKKYTDQLRSETIAISNIEIINGDIFDSTNEIESKIKKDDVSLFIGNPPWVTNAGVASINGTNVPVKENLKDLRGIEAITGKSNFDISEYILLKLIERFNKGKCVFAFLCKTIVARNLLKWSWDNGISYLNAEIFPIDSKKYFNAAVDACFFIIDFTKKTDTKECIVYDSIENCNFVSTHGYYKRKIIVDINKFVSHNYFGESEYIWRNGIKHDCAKVMELDEKDGILRNGYNEIVDIESDLVFSLLKSSDLAKSKIIFRKKVIVTQTKVGEQTFAIKQFYPKTWAYLNKYKAELDGRKSSIYKNKPSFSIFSIGDYSFKPYKIAISGLYKKISFQILEPVNNKPVMVDDTCNFISFDTEAEAHFIFGLLTSMEVTTFLNATIFWDSKRPITTEVLNSIDLYKVAITLGLGEHYKQLCRMNNTTNCVNIFQTNLF